VTSASLGSIRSPRCRQPRPPSARTEGPRRFRQRGLRGEWAAGSAGEGARQLFGRRVAQALRNPKHRRETFHLRWPARGRGLCTRLWRGSRARSCMASPGGSACEPQQRFRRPALAKVLARAETKKAATCEVACLLVHNHDTYLRVMDPKRSRGEAVEVRADTRGRDSRRPTKCGAGGPSHEPSKL